MVIEVKVVAVFLVGIMISVGGVYMAAPDAGSSDEDVKAPVSKVLPAKGLYYLWFEPDPPRRGLADGFEMSEPQQPAGYERPMDANVLVDGEDGVVIRWAGKDDRKGTGVAYYDVQAKAGDGEWVDWRPATTDHHAMYYPTDEGTFYFRCRAVDNAGNVEPYPDRADTQFKVKVIQPGDVVDVEVNLDLVDREIPRPNCPPPNYCTQEEEGEV